MLIQIFFVKRSQYISIKNPLHKQSEKACMCISTRHVRTSEFTIYAILKSHLSNIQFRLSADKLKCAIELTMERRIKTFPKHFHILESKRWYLAIKIACVINYEKDCDSVYQIKIDSNVPDTANSSSLHALFSEQA